MQQEDSENLCKQLARSYKKATSSLARQKETLVRLKLPSWLRVSTLCFEFRGRRSLYSMALDVKVYRIVSYSAPIFQFSRTGNVVAIQEMFSKGTATPNDMTVWGQSILEVISPTSCHTISITNHSLTRVR
jgi:hypothetical protein